MAQNPGIIGIEIFFPKTYVSQKALEQFDKVSTGKYTIGLGQESMSFVDEFEDVNSLALTVVQQTLEKYQINPKNVGRLEVGTETLLDKSKSTKTVLMQLLSHFGNNDVEGVTSINACYGGTNALFNTLNWIQSQAWDGRLGLVVTVDIAVYKKGPARPTGGAGAICMVIGENAPIQFENLRATFMEHVFDFYKPDPNSEYPVVDGQQSINTYLNAIDKCYSSLNQKFVTKYGSKLSFNDYSYACFHAPFNKMVQKAFYRLYFDDLINNAAIDKEKDIIQSLEHQDYNSKQVQDYVQRRGKQIWTEKVAKGTYLGTQLGNIYTGSLYAGLVSLICDETLDLKNKQILMFSYGSGLAASLFCLKVNSSLEEMKQKINLKNRLRQRIEIDPTQYDAIMAKKEKQYGTKEYSTQVINNFLYSGAYYLQNVDKSWRREYKRYFSNDLAQNKTCGLENRTQYGESNAVERLSTLKAQLK